MTGMQVSSFSSYSHRSIMWVRYHSKENKMQLSKNGIVNARWVLVFKMEIQVYPWEKTRGNKLKFTEKQDKYFFKDKYFYSCL